MGTDLSVHTAEDLAVVQVELSYRPRKTLQWDSPASRLATLLATPFALATLGSRGRAPGHGPR
jgi:IS30 family transposase